MAGRHTVEITEQIRRSSDIVDIVSSYVTLKRAGRQFRGLCPFHSEKSPSFHVTPDRQIFKCFGCGVGGDVFKFVQLRESVDFLEARQILAAKAGIDLQHERPTESASESIGKPDLERVNRWAAAWFQQQFLGTDGESAREYVRTRGITEESIKAFGLGFAPDGWSALVNAASQKNIPPTLLLAAGLIKQRDEGNGFYDAFRNRLMFPIQDAMGRVIGFGGRALGDDNAKYLNSPQTVLFDKSRCLYGLNAAKDAFRDGKRAVVVEGYIDCLMAHQFGFTETVATLGTALTLDHVQMLRRYVDEVVLLFDADSAGQRAANQSLPLFFTSDVSLRLAQVPEGKDPADLLLQKGAEALRTALTSAVGALESKWKQVLSRCRSGDGGPDVRRAVEEFLGLVAQSQDFGAGDPIQRGLLINQVGKLLGLSNEEINRQMRILGRKAPVVSASKPTAVERVAPPSNAADSAMRDLLEVLLNEPTYYESVRSEFDASLIGDADLAEIARGLSEIADAGGEWTVSSLIGRFESVRIGGLIVDLQMAGERGGNFAARVEGAVATLQKVRDRERIVALTAEGRGETNQASSKLRAAGEAARRMSHFAARRHMTATPLIPGAASSEAHTADNVSA